VVPAKGIATPRSFVFVSATEYRSDDGVAFMGPAGLAVYNVVPGIQQVTIKFHNTWTGPLNVRLSMLIITLPP
jgi:hypothetical protein